MVDEPGGKRGGVADSKTIPSLPRDLAEVNLAQRSPEITILREPTWWAAGEGGQQGPEGIHESRVLFLGQGYWSNACWPGPLGRYPRSVSNRCFKKV